MPATAFINDVKADLHDANTVYVVLDNHKYGDYKPYLAKSNDRGATWTSIKGNLPNKMLLWRIVQDHEEPDLMFLGTEWGIYFTLDAGKQWTKLEGGTPTISFRDLAIQKRENDLIGASFGRGFFILDDYSFMRDISPSTFDEEAALFTPRKAWWYIPRSHLNFDNEKGTMGASHYVAPNPDFGAVFTYYLKDKYNTLEDQRQTAEKGRGGSFPGWEKADAEKEEPVPEVFIVVSDMNGNAIRRVTAPNKKGMNRVAWDLRYPAPNAIGIKAAGNPDFQPKGLMVAPGTYQAQLFKKVNGEASVISEKVTVEVVPLREGALQGASKQEVANFWRSYEQATKDVTRMDIQLANSMKRVKAMQRALAQSQSTPGQLDNQLNELRNKLLAIDKELYGSPAKREIGEKTKTTIGSRLFSLNIGISRSTYGPTETHKTTLDNINSEMSAIDEKLKDAAIKMSQLDEALKKAGAPYIEWE